jgi:membrane-bound ClpP family serine protease
VVEQLVQIVGALLVLLGFALAQFDQLDEHSAAYLIVNLLGSAILAADAVMSGQLGFLLLEGVWALISAWGLTRMITTCTERASSRAVR